MKVYDIALMLIRAIIALDLIREVAALTFDIPRALAILAAAGGTHYFRVLETTTIVSPIYSIVISVIIFANSKRISRFAAKFAASSDAAAAFH